MKLTTEVVYEQWGAFRWWSIMVEYKGNRFISCLTAKPLARQVRAFQKSVRHMAG